MTMTTINFNTRHCSKGSVWIISFNPHNNPTRQVLALPQSYRRGNYNTDKVNILPKVTHWGMKVGFEPRRSGSSQSSIDALSSLQEEASTSGPGSALRALESFLITCFWLRSVPITWMVLSGRECLTPYPNSIGEKHKQNTARITTRIKVTRSTDGTARH